MAMQGGLYAFWQNTAWENQYLVSISHTAIADMLNTNELKPHLSKYWCIPKLYCRPPEFFP